MLSIRTSLRFNSLDRRRHDTFLYMPTRRPGPDELPAFILRLYPDITEPGFPEQRINFVDKRRTCNTSGMKGKIISYFIGKLGRGNNIGYSKTATGLEQLEAALQEQQLGWLTLVQ